MASEADWREAARGIPVWEGCLGIWTRHGGRFGSSYRAEVDAEPDLIPDLSDPDTRAAYDRRLALALGAPEEAVGAGVVLWPDEDSCWHIAAGVGFHAATGATGFVWTQALGSLADMGAPLLARAIAWPADKRVNP